VADWQRPTYKEIAEAAIEYVQKHEAAMMADHAIEIDDTTPLSELRAISIAADDEFAAAARKLKRLVHRRIGQHG